MQDTEKTVSVNFTLDELMVVRFLITHRNDPDASDRYQEFIETVGETHVGLKVIDAIAEHKSTWPAPSNQCQWCGKNFNQCDCSSCKAEK